MANLIYCLSQCLSMIMRILLSCLIPYLYNWIVSLPHNRGRFKWKVQTICKFTIESLTGREFFTIRPSWLMNPQTKRNMELDCFNEEMALALEYNGRQHYKHTSRFHSEEPSGMKKLELQVYRDELKKSLCDKMGISLIIVPYTISKYNMCSYIMGKLLLVRNSRK